MLVVSLWAKIDTVYYDNTVVRSIVEYKNGVENGETKKYDPEGNLRLKTIFKNGKVDGVTIRFYENGMMMDSLNIIDGNNIGWAKRWDLKGLFKSKTLYKNGKEVEYFSYFKGLKQVRQHSLYKYDKKVDKNLLIMMYSYNRKGDIIAQIRNGNGRFKKIGVTTKQCKSHKVYSKGLEVLKNYNSKEKPDCSPMVKSKIKPWDIKKYGYIK